VLLVVAAAAAGRLAGPPRGDRYGGRLVVPRLWTTGAVHRQPVADCRIGMYLDAVGDALATRSPRFLHLADVAEVLNISSAQAYALVRSGDLPAIKVGGRGQWRVEASILEEYIQRLYAETRDFVAAHPWVPSTDSSATTDGPDTRET
jgi:excisionase family DNA binding protein